MKNGLFFFSIILMAVPFAGCSQKNKMMEPESSSRKTVGSEVLDSVELRPFSILQYNVQIKCSDLQTRGYSFLKFYDSTGRELLVYTSGAVSSLSYQSSGTYTEAPPFTRYAKIGIEKDSSGSGYLLSDSMDVKLNIGVPTVQHSSLCDPGQYMKPFWNTDTIYNETVLMYKDTDLLATGKLLFVPDQIISVKRFDLSAEFHAGADYTFNGRLISRPNGSGIPFVAADFFSTLDLAWYNLQSKWVVVTYTHHDAWNGPLPVYKGANLPHLMAKLKSGAPVKIIGYGMSITRGLDISSYDDVAPFMPTYLDLFAHRLREIYHDDGIEMINAGLPGALVSWGAAYAEKYINPLQPDLVIIDFGMNDFWRYTPAEFKGYIQTIVTKVKSEVPDAEFLLISNMDFDPEYILKSDPYQNFYVSNMQGYKLVLRDLESRGIVNLDMTSLSDALYLRKKARDCISNPLHPNDYMARWYAQGLVALLRPSGN